MLRLRLLSLTMMFCGWLATSPSFAQKVTPWQVHEEPDGSCSYRTKSGKKMLGNYFMCETRVLTRFAKVADPQWVLINRKGEHLYTIFNFDNAPDEPHNGLYRVYGKDRKLGFVSEKTGRLVIPAQYACAFPFENGRAQVAFTCTEVQDGEHTLWKSDAWFLINTRGEKLAH